MVKLREECVNRPEDPLDFNADNVRSMAEVLRKSGGLVPSGGVARIVPALVSAIGVHIEAKSLTRLEEATHTQ